MLKVSKAEAGYISRPGSEFLCGGCVMLKELGKGGFGCAWFGPAETVSATSGSCNWFAQGDHAKLAIPWLGLYTKTELGYAENKGGFGCRRCEYIAIPERMCRKVDENSAGDTPGEISPTTGCCGLWDGDKKRKKMTTPELMQMFAGLNKNKLVQITTKGQ